MMMMAVGYVSEGGRINNRVSMGLLSCLP